MLESFGQAVQYLGSISVWLYIIVGVVIGLVFGIIPGISGMLAVALLLPFVFVMTPEQGLPLLMAIIATQFQGGSISAILLNIPGEAPSAATCIDGFPMAEKGQAGRAIGAAQTASAAGGVLSALVALAIIPLAVPMIMGIGTADMVFIIIMGLSFIAVLCGASAIKGIISGLVGLLIAFIGNQASTGVERFTFGSAYLYDGLQLIPISLGLFAVPEMIVLSVKGGTIARGAIKIQGMQNAFEGVKDVFRYYWTWLRSSLIGFIVGIIPGIGANVATFISYGQAKQTSKHPELFGTGIVEGVIAPQSAVNAGSAGDLLTTLALGIPGSAIFAIVMGAMRMLGITPGPQMMTQHLPLAINLLFVLIISNVIGSAICFALATKLSLITYTPSVVLVPVVVAMVLVGSFTYGNAFNNLIVTLAFGAVGLAMRSFGYSRPALFLGYILGYLFEQYFFRALQMKGPLFFTSPLSIAIILITIGLFCLTPIRKALERRKAKQA